eukprot:UC1_evm1s1861
MGIRARAADYSLNLAAVLNDPRRRARDTDLFTRDWGDAFVPVPVGSIPPSPRLRVPSQKQLRGVRNRFAAECESRRLEARKRIASATIRGRDLETLSALDTVPQLFFEASFDLRRPETFEAVIQPNGGGGSGGSDAGGGGGGGSGGGDGMMTSSRLQQERLSHYLDIIEVELARQIAMRSERFFGAVSSHEELAATVALTVSQIASYRKRLAVTQAVVSNENLLALQRVRRRRNAARLNRMLETISAVNQAQATVQLLLATCDYVGALDVITTTKEVLRDELSGVGTVRYVGPQLSEIESHIEKILEHELLSVVLDDTKAVLTSPDVHLEDDVIRALTPAPSSGGGDSGDEREEDEGEQGGVPVSRSA